MYSTGADKPMPKRRPNQCSIVDKAVVKLVWSFDLEPTPARAQALARACQDRGIAISKIDDKAITRLLELCGHRD